MAIATAPRGFYLNCAFRFGIRADGVAEPTNYYDNLNLTKLELTGQTQESDDLPSNIDGQIGELLASVNKPTEAASLTAELNYMPPVLWAVLMGADLTEVTQTADTVTDSAITVTNGLWTKLPDTFINPTGITCKTAADATVTASGNYEVDTVSGMIKGLSVTGATITKISYTKLAMAAGSAHRYDAGKAKSTYCKFIGTATDKITNTKGLLIIHNVNLAPSSTFDPVTGTYASGALTGKMITPSGQSSPWSFTPTGVAAS
jgi:hypothetical protein